MHGQQAKDILQTYTRVLFLSFHTKSLPRKYYEPRWQNRDLKWCWGELRDIHPSTVWETVAAGVQLCCKHSPTVHISLPSFFTLHQISLHLMWHFFSAPKHFWPRSYKGLSSNRTSIAQLWVHCLNNWPYQLLKMIAGYCQLKLVEIHEISRKTTPIFTENLTATKLWIRLIPTNQR